MSPDDYTSDPSDETSGVPGTVDDLPAEFGEDLLANGDQPTRKSPAASVTDYDVKEDGGEGDLWGRQKPLVEEDEKEGLKLEGFEADEIPEILDAMGDDAAEPLIDSPNGTSATGLWGTPEHGGFPERND